MKNDLTTERKGSKVVAVSLAIGRALLRPQLPMWGRKDRAATCDAMNGNLKMVACHHSPKGVVTRAARSK